MALELSGTDVVVLVGGLGTRLQSLPGRIPKVLRPVQGRPFLEHLVDQVVRHGGRRMILALGHLKEAFTPFLGIRPGGLEVLGSAEPAPLGTGGALRLALSKVKTRTLLVMNGDSYVDADFGLLVGEHRRRGSRATLLLTEVDDAARFGRVETGPSGEIVRFVEKGAAGPGAVNAGVYLLERDIVESIPEGTAVSLERDFFPALVGKGFHGVRGRFRFIDIGTPESYAEAETYLGARSQP
jgi:NDP-sugar pyrophosphorylase family protein